MLLVLLLTYVSCVYMCAFGNAQASAHPHALTRDSCINNILQLLLLVVNGGVVLAVVTGSICRCPLPFYAELLLCLLALEPMEVHVHGLRSLWDHAACGGAIGSVVVCD
eukprot:6939263-Ditylum_brightwellii.AAC.1